MHKYTRVRSKRFARTYAQAVSMILSLIESWHRRFYCGAYKCEYDRTNTTAQLVPTHACLAYDILGIPFEKCTRPPRTAITMIIINNITAVEIPRNRGAAACSAAFDDRSYKIFHCCATN